ncbi:MAG: sodium:solute symporter family protein [Candidatus Thermoplasmatota archaeon]|nr:sodium:solute symporter family protein [Candidatus Thermoplasmatota archaeon]
MLSVILAISLFFSILLFLGFLAKKKSIDTTEDYFVAGRSFGAIVLFFSLIATNFSAFTFLGFSGKSFVSGFGQYGIMAFGTGFMALSFYLIGRKVWRLGKTQGYITPAELVGKELNSKILRYLFMSILVIYTIPYLATQAIGAGMLIMQLTETLVSWQIGAVITMLVLMIYTFLGGMRGSGWTDVAQGVLMIIALVFAFVFVAHGLGGIEAANTAAFQQAPTLFSRPGLDSYFSIQVWFSFMILWLFANPMFPQLFSRFYTAKNETALKWSMLLYPLAVAIVFFIPVAIGVWAHGATLDVSASQSDMILPLMVKQYAPSGVYLFVMIGALAALMSTADSQLLSLATMFSQDLPFKKKKNTVKRGRIFIFLLVIGSILFILLAYDASEGIMGTLVKSTFSGLAVLFPTVFAVLYWKKTTALACILSIIIGQLSIILFELGVLNTGGFLPAIWSVLIATITIIIVSMIDGKKFKDLFITSS